MADHIDMMNTCRAPATINEALYWVVTSGYDLYVESYNDYVDIIVRNDNNSDEDYTNRKLSDSESPEVYESTIIECVREQLVRDKLVNADRVPQRGDIAVCSAGLTGMIMSSKRTLVTYRDGSTGMAWVGVHLENRPDRGVKAGDPWSSRNPEVICNITDLWDETCKIWASGYDWIMQALKCHVMSCDDPKLLEHYHKKTANDNGSQLSQG